MKQLCSVVLVTLSLSAAAEPLQDTADTYVEDARRTPAVAIVRATPAGLERAVAGPESVTAESLFEIGSIGTKVFTGVLLAEMVARNEVSLETTVGEVLGTAVELDPAVASITLKELATHSSGLPRSPISAAMMVEYSYPRPTRIRT